MNELRNKLLGFPGGWKREAEVAIQKLCTQGLEAASYTFGMTDSLTFYGTTEGVKREILHAFFPVYLGTSLLDGKLKELPPSVIDYLDCYKPWQSKPLLAILKEAKTTSAVWRAGDNTTVHSRFVVVHHDVDMVTNWMWDMIGSLKFQHVSRIVMCEE